MAKGDRKWSETMHDDLLDGVKWAIDKGVTAKDRVAVMGLSYGGYSTLVGLSFTPDTFQCGRSEEHTSELQSIMRISYAVFCLYKNTQKYKEIDTYEVKD